MMRSLSSAVAGLRSHQTRMDVIGNNIANVNTYGFKSSRVTFADVYYQNLSSSKAGTSGVSGGKNPTQIGYGSSVATIDVMNSTTGAATTDRAMDVYITGEGFLVSKDASGRLSYSRLGNLGFDAAGNLIDGSGQLIQGFPMRTDENGNLVPNISSSGSIVSDQLQGISVDPKILEKLTGISISSSGAIIGLLEGDPVVNGKSTNPAWLNNNSLSIPANSTYSGAVNLAISGFTNTGVMSQAFGLSPTDVTKIEMGSLALPASGLEDYKVSVDRNGNVTMSRPAVGVYGTEEYQDAVTLTGALKNGQLVLKNNAGEIGLTITFDKTTVTNLPTTKVMETTTKVLTSTNAGLTNQGYVAYYDGTMRSAGAGNELKDITAVDATYQLYYDSNGNPVEDGSGNQYYVKAVPLSALRSDDPVTPLYKSDGTPLDDGGSPAEPLYAAYGITGKQVTDTNNKPLYVKAVTSDKLLTGEALVPLYKPDGTPLMDTADPTKQLYAAYGSIDNDYPRTLQLDLYMQMTTTDKGGNVIREPAEPLAFTNLATGENSKTLQFGDLSFDITAVVPDKGFNGIIGTAEPDAAISYYIGNLVLAKFQNPGGLAEAGTSYFQETLNSGDAAFIMPGMEGTGALKSGYLEMSNVDVSKEFTDMITTQRGFQANSRIISVSDEMLQELVNLKR